jgi:hypothetical protein
VSPAFALHALAWTGNDPSALDPAYTNPDALDAVRELQVQHRPNLCNNLRKLRRETRCDRVTVDKHNAPARTCMYPTNILAGSHFRYPLQPLASAGTYCDGVAVEPGTLSAVEDELGQVLAVVRYPAEALTPGPVQPVNQSP